MAKKKVMPAEKVEAKENLNVNVWSPVVRPVVPVPCRTIDQKIEVVQGKSDSVAKLYQDYVLGRLDPSQIGNGPVYDDPNSDSVDPFNHFGVTLEETTRISEEGTQARKDIEDYARKQKEKEKTPPPAKQPKDTDE